MQEMAYQNIWPRLIGLYQKCLHVIGQCAFSALQNASTVVGNSTPYQLKLGFSWLKKNMKSGFLSRWWPKWFNYRFISSKFTPSNCCAIVFSN